MKITKKDLNRLKKTAKYVVVIKEFNETLGYAPEVTLYGDEFGLVETASPLYPRAYIVTMGVIYDFRLVDIVRIYRKTDSEKIERKCLFDCRDAIEKAAKTKIEEIEKEERR